MKAKTVTKGEAGRAESLQAEGCTAPVWLVLQGESLALPCGLRSSFGPA